MSGPVAAICKQASKPVARVLCRQLVSKHDADQKQLDQGHEQTQVQYNKLRRLLVGGSDTRISDPEIYDHALEVADKQYRAGSGATLLGSHLNVPWHPDRRQVDVQRMQAAMVSIIKQAGSKTNPVRFAERLFSQLTKPRQRGGFGLQFDTQFAGPPRDLAKIYRDRKANCLEFVVLMCWLVDRAGISVVPLEMLRSSAGHAQQHLLIGFKDPQTGQITHVADLQTGRFGKAKRGDIMSPLSRRELLAYAYLNRGVGQEIGHGNLVEAERLVDQALQLSPDNYLILYHKGYYRARAKDYSTAIRFLTDARRVNTNFADTYQALIELGQLTGDYALVRQTRYDRVRVSHKGLLFD